MNGILRPSEKLHEIKMKFEENIPQKDTLAQSYGTFVLCKDVYNARKVIRTAWDKEKDTLTIIIDLRSYHVRPKRPAQFSFSIQINDSTFSSCSSVKDKYPSLKTVSCSSINLPYKLCFFQIPQLEPPSDQGFCTNPK